MEFLKQKVAGNKARYKQKGYNLDLTYITNRIIAMAFPATGLEKLFRNSIDDVRKFLLENHQDNYIVINLSGRNIDQNKLKNVHKYDWEDHKAPPFQTLFQICEEVMSFLSKDINRVAVIHCNHGKGRTGTIISCLLMYAGFFDNPTNALQFYEKKRFIQGSQGVSQPCQINYVRYFGNFLKNPRLRPQIVCLKSVTFHGNYNLSDPYLKLKRINCGKTLVNTKQSRDVTLIQKEKQGEFIFKFSEDIPLIGDIILEIKNDNSFGNNYIGSYTFNTMFIPNKLAFNLPLTQLSPQSLIQKDYFGVNFKLQLHFKLYCSCLVSTPLKFRCQKCYKYYNTQQAKLKKISKSISYRQQIKQITYHQLLFGKKIQNQNNCSHRKISPSK